MVFAEKLLKSAVLNEMPSCPVCGCEYRLSDLSVVAEGPAMWLMRLDCRACADWTFAAVVLKQGDAAAAHHALSRLRAGASPDELLDGTTGKHGAVDADDVRAMTAFLATFDGDFARLFRDDG